MTLEGVAKDLESRFVLAPSEELFSRILCLCLFRVI